MARFLEKTEEEEGGSIVGEFEVWVFLEKESRGFYTISRSSISDYVSLSFFVNGGFGKREILCDG